jgi:hypothetical protein
MIQKVGWDVFRDGHDAAADLTIREVSLLDRLASAVSPGAGEWLRSRKAQLAASAFRQLLAAQRLNWADGYTEDAVGQLRAGDIDSAVLSARLAFGCTMDAALALVGECGPGEKWRARRVKAAELDAISFEQYWSLETMRTFEGSRPEIWIKEVLACCRQLSMKVDLG